MLHSVLHHSYVMDVQTPSLLARDAPRSERDPDLQAASTANVAEFRVYSSLTRRTDQDSPTSHSWGGTNLAMRALTGTFADSSHESAFAAQLFRLAFPAHILLMALSLAISIWESLLWTSAEKPLGVAFLLCTETLGLVGRILLHYHLMHDLVRAQRWGSRVWTVTTVLSCIAIVCWYAIAPASELAKEDFSTSLAFLAVALTNGSHGMGFLQKLALMGALLACDLSVLALCGEVVLPSTLMDVGTAVVGTVLAHMAELKMRHSYAEKRRLAEERRQLEEIRKRLDQKLLEQRNEQGLLEQRNEQLRKEKDRLDYERRFALHQVGLKRSETGARERATCVGPPSVDMLTSGCGGVPVETALYYPLAQPAGGGRHVSWTHPANASDSQCAREQAPVVGILRGARVTTEWSGGASTGGDSSSTEPEITHILPTNASLGARMPLPLEMPQPVYPLRLSHCSSEASSGSRMVDAGLPPRAAGGDMHTFRGAFTLSGASTLPGASTLSNMHTTVPTEMDTNMHTVPRRTVRSWFFTH